MAVYYNITHRYEPRTTLATRRYSKNDSFRLGNCERIEDWDPCSVVEISVENGPPEDIPWLISGSETLGSARFCKLLMEFDPHCAQVLPVQCHGPAEHGIRLDSYSIINWLHYVDCTDLSQTTFEPHPIFGYPVPKNFTIDPKLIPRDLHVFRVKHAEVCLFATKRFIDFLSTNQIVGFRKTRYN